MRLYEVLEVCGSLYADFKCRDEHGRQCGGLVAFHQDADGWRYQLFTMRGRKSISGGKKSEPVKRRLEIDNMARVALDQAFWRTRENSPEKDPLF